MASYILSIMHKHDLEKYAEYSARGFASLAGMDFEVVVGEDVEALLKEVLSVS